MPIPGPGTAISMNTIATEFGGTVPHSLSEYYRGGGLVPNTPTNAAIPTSGQIAMGNFYGASNRVSIPITISANTYNYDVYTNRGPTYSPGISDITVTVNPGVTVGSTTTPAYAMLVPNAFNPGDTVTIVNNGVIQGMGGGGGAGGLGRSAPRVVNPGSPGASGGSALYVNRPVTVTNNGTIAGGGGGGGGGGAAVDATAPAKTQNALGGGGGGGGAGFNGGGGGTGGQGITQGQAPFGRPGSPGGSGTSPAGGGGGAGGAPAPTATSGSGGSGGGRGATGSTGGSGSSTSGSPASSSGGSGGAAGNYIVGNPFVTWPATGTRQGGVA